MMSKQLDLFRPDRPRKSSAIRGALRRFTAGLAAFALTGLALAAPASATRIKDIADFEGIRDNMLVGYGLVVGLNGTGDDLGSAIFTRESLVGMLQRMGVNADDTSLDVDNVAAVMVTAVLPPFARQGSRIDVTLSAIGDAESLMGGTLVVTPLSGADGEIYAVAQGQIAVGGFTAQGNAQTVSRGVTTSGRISNGAIVEREIGFELASLETVKIALKNPDLTTSRRMANAINAFLGQPAARPLDAGTVHMQIPPSYRGDVVALMTDVEQLQVEPDQMARVVIDEQSGIIVMGENVRISTVAIAQGNLTVRITETAQVSQPNPFAPDSATTEIVDRTDIEIDDDAEKRFGIVPESVTLNDLVRGLNSLGIGPRDMIRILQAIKEAGALQADLEMM